MPSNYPSAPDNLPAGHVDNIGELIHALHVNRLDEAINAIQGELGNTPSGAYSSVRARLDDTGGGVPSTGVNRDALTVAADGSTLWSAKAAPYNPYEAAAGVGQGNAVTDTAALQATVTAAGGNGPMLIPPGNPLLVNASAVRIPSNSRIYGHGRGKSVLKIADGTADGEWITNSSFTNGNSNIVIQDIEIDGNKANRPVGGAGMVQFRCNHATTLSSNIHVRRVYLHDSAGIGISLYSAQDSSIVDCTVGGNQRDGMGVYRRGIGVQLIGNTVYDCGDDLIAIHASQDPTHGLGEYTSDVVVMANHLRGGSASGNAVNLTGVRRASVIGNQILSAYHNAIEVRQNNGTHSEEVKIIGNSIRDNGAQIAGTADVSWGITLQVESDPANWYAQLGVAPVRNITIMGNDIINPMSHGIRLLGASGNMVSHVNIVGNQLVGGARYNAAAGIFIMNAFAQYVRVANNTIRDWQGRGFRNESSASYLGLYNNLFLNNGRSGTGSREGIYLGAATHVKMHGNEATDNGSPKLQTHGVNYGTASNVLSMGNDFRGNLTAAASNRTGGVIERMNVDNAGVLRIGDTGTAGYM